MGIVDYKREAIAPIKDIAQELYDKQVKDITNISHTNGYKEIKRYWASIKEGSEIELRSVREEFLKITQLKYKLASEFVTFLENLESTKEVRAKTKAP